MACGAPRPSLTASGSTQQALWMSRRVSTSLLARVQKLHREVFHRTPVSDEDHKAIVDRVILGAKLGEPEAIRTYFKFLRRPTLSPTPGVKKKPAAKKASPSISALK
jgi:hypothetical protein